MILRFAGLYGPGRIVRRALIERGEPIPGDPSKLFNLIQIEDAARVAAAALAAASPDGLYLVSDDRPVTRGEYYSLLATLLNAPGADVRAGRRRKPGRGARRHEQARGQSSDEGRAGDRAGLSGHLDRAAGVAGSLKSPRGGSFQAAV